MAEHPEPSEENKSGHLHSLREFLQARWDLLHLEAKEASQTLTRRLAVTVAAAGAAIVAYLLLVVTAGWTLQVLLSTVLPDAARDWAGPLAAGTLFLLHLVAAFVLFSRARAKTDEKLFECTRTEWKKDQAWLQKETSRDRNSS